MLTNAKRVALRAALEALRAANDQRPVGALPYAQAFDRGTHVQLAAWLNEPDEGGALAFPEASTAQDLLGATSLADLAILSPAARDFWFAIVGVAPLNLNTAAVRAKLLELWGAGPGATLARQLARPATRVEVLLADGSLNLGGQTVVLGYVGPVGLTELSEALIGKAVK